MKKLLWLFFLASSLAFGQSQAVRIENFTWTTNRIGGIRPVVPIPDATVQVCNFPANAVPCSNYATTYTDISMGTVCNGTNGCSNPMTSDDNGKFGVWVAPGTYQYTYTTSSGLNFGPYTVTLALNGTITVTNHNLLSTVHPDTVPYSPPVFGDLIMGNASGLWARSPGNTTSTPQWFRSTGDGINVTQEGFVPVGGPCPSGQFQIGINGDITPQCSSNAPITNIAPNPPIQPPAGQFVAWAFPTIVTPYVGNGSPSVQLNDWSTAAITANDARYIAGSSGGTLTRYGSGPLHTYFDYYLVWSGFALPTLPSDAVIQNIYAVTIADRSSTSPIGYSTISCSNSGGSSGIVSSTTGNYSGYFANIVRSMGSTSAAVTGASCTLDSASSISASGNDPQTVQMIGLAIYYTTSQAPAQQNSLFYINPYYPSINGVSTGTDALADGTPISWNISGSYIRNASVTLNHVTPTRALNVSGMQTGGVYNLRILQDATGGAALTGGTGCTWYINNVATTTIPVVSTANAISYLTFRYDGTNCLVTMPQAPSGATLIASGTAALNTAAIASGACDAVVTVAATGVLTTDVLNSSFNGDPTAVNGYTPSTSGTLTIFSYPTANNVNFKVCNTTSGSITPGAITLNWRVTR